MTISMFNWLESRSINFHLTSVYVVTILNVVMKFHTLLLDEKLLQRMLVEKIEFTVADLLEALIFVLLLFILKFLIILIYYI